MGSDMAMNPPKPVYDTYTVDTQEEVIDYVIGALATKKQIIVNQRRNDTDKYRIQIFTGEWR